MKHNKMMYVELRPDMLKVNSFSQWVKELKFKTVVLIPIWSDS